MAKHNFAATVAPTITDDANAGYAVGSKWVDTVAGVDYTCTDPTPGAAVWSGGGGGSGDVTGPAGGTLANQLVVYADNTGKALKAIDAPVDAAGQPLGGAPVITFPAEFDNGSLGAAPTINWNNGQKQRGLLTAATTIAFTNPPSPGNFQLKLTQDGTGGHTVAWPAAVRWPGGSAPVISAGAGEIDVIAFYFDGTNYYAQAAQNFS